MAEPKKIVSLAPSNTQIVLGLGLQDKIVGCTRFCPKFDAKKPPVIVGGWLDVDYDKVAALKPDLVLTSTFLQERIADVLEERGLKVFHVDPKDLSDVLQSFADLGKALGEPQTGKDLQHLVQRQLRGIQQQTRGLPRKRVYVEEWHKPPTASGNWVPEIVETAGGISGLARPGMRSAPVSTEQVQQFDPEVIVAAWCGFCGKEDLGVIRNREGWQGITAIKTGRVHSLDDNYLNSPDPRLGEGAKRLAALFHPDIF